MQKSIYEKTILLLALFASSLVLAGPGFRPHVSPSDPGPSLQIPLPKSRAMLPQPTVHIQGLKAVLIGAPIDGDYGPATRREVKNLQRAAAEFRKNKVRTYEFYSPNNQWRDIRRAARGAHFLLYRGHGVYDGSRPPKWVGGLSLKQEFISPKQLRRDLRLAKGAIVMLYGCFTAGNAGFDIGRITEQEAIRRVGMYSEPFLERGFAGYYANWYGDAFQHYVAWLFAGKSLGDAWKAYRDYNAATTRYTRHPGLQDEVLWLDHDKGKSGIVYNNAFAGKADATLLDLFTKPSDFVKFKK